MCSATQSLQYLACSIRPWETALCQQFQPKRKAYTKHLSWQLVVGAFVWEFIESVGRNHICIEWDSNSNAILQANMKYRALLPVWQMFFYSSLSNIWFLKESYAWKKKVIFFIYYWMIVLFKNVTLFRDSYQNQRRSSPKSFIKSVKDVPSNITDPGLPNWRSVWQMGPKGGGGIIKQQQRLHVIHSTTI